MISSCTAFAYKLTESQTWTKKTKQIAICTWLKCFHIKKNRAEEKTAKCNKDINHLRSILTRAPISWDTKQKNEHNNRRKKKQRRQCIEICSPSYKVVCTMHLFKVISIHMLWIKTSRWEKESEKKNELCKIGSMHIVLFEFFPQLPSRRRVKAVIFVHSLALFVMCIQFHQRRDNGIIMKTTSLLLLR